LLICLLQKLAINADFLGKFMSVFRASKLKLDRSYLMSEVLMFNQN